MRGLVAVLSVVLTLAGWTAESLVLCGEGAPAGRAIVMPLETSESVRYAARELASYLERITGEKLPVIDDSWPAPDCRIALVPDESLGTDGFRLRVEGTDLTIRGSAVRGILYGVYDLLETYGGVGWYSSTRTVVPRAKGFAVPCDLDRTERPAFAVREPLWSGAMHDADFAARLRLNGESMRPQARHGGNAFRFGGGLGNAHTFPILVPPEEFFADHPEYFALVNGARIPDGQLCLSNPEVLRLVTERVLERIRRDPGAKYFGVSQRDTLGFCECPACAAIDAQAESHAGSVIRFVNAVAEVVEKEFPDKVIETLAYQFSRKPPKGIRPRANVMPCLCSIECDFKDPLVRSGCAENAAFVEDLKGWAKLTDRLYVWDYTTNFLQYQLPFPNVQSMGPNLRLFRDAGVTTIFSEGAYNSTHAEFAELKTWVLAKLMWNPDQDVDKLVERFVRGHYGPAAPYVMRYIKALEALPRQTAEHPLGIYQDVDDPILTDAFLKAALKLWRAAEVVAKDDPECCANVRAGMLPVVYTMLLRRARGGVKKVSVTRRPGRFAVDRSTPELLALFEREFAALGAPLLSESQKRHEAYLAEIRELGRERSALAKADRAIVEETELTLHGPGVNGTFVDDPLALNGRAIRLGNDHHLWCVVLRLREVAYDPGVTYRLRARVRVEKGTEDGQVFSCGVYDDATRRSCGAREPRLSETGEGYAWYDVLEWKPSDLQYVWFAPGWFTGTGPSKAHQAVYLDCLELTRD